ncbi:hypothetical protein ACFODT_12225 [Vibrio zhugei]|uniref:SH3 domain-containing protein n=1 Tax=Vibrio zhugei TaxID=2479546 RepID=A0ABV7C955_9VIBR|nr:SH3 domain-containing protein [Vibrio zhugei]
MKKLLMLVLLLLGITAAGAGYYLFYYAPSHGDVLGLNALLGKTPPPATPTKARVEQTTATTAPPSKPVMDYYVSSKTLPIRSQPDEQAFIEGQLYRGDKVSLLEKSAGWGRITEYFVYKQGEDPKAKWIPLQGLVVEKPVITPKERKKTVLDYIHSSDDLGKYEDMFFKVTNTLLTSKQCKPEDFEETGGWVKSVYYEGKDIYFVYCGGLGRVNKIYLDASNGQTFRSKEPSL